MVAFGRSVPQEKRSLIFGVATAASSFGQFIFAPIGQGFIGAFGWQSALVYLAIFLVLALPLTFALRGKAAASATGMPTCPSWQALRRAWAIGSYRLLVIGFFVCGFHLAFINVHLPAYLVQCGLTPDVGSWSHRRHRPVQHRGLADRRLSRRPRAQAVAAGLDLFPPRRRHRRSSCCSR